MTDIKRNKAIDSDALVPPPPPPDAVPETSAAVGSEVPAPAAAQDSEQDPATTKPAYQQDSKADSPDGVTAETGKDTAFATDWKKLALGDDPEDIDDVVSPYQIKEESATTPSTAPQFTSGGSEVVGGVHEVPSPTQTETGREPVETVITAPKSPDMPPEIPGGIKPGVTPDISLAPHETSTSPKPPTPAETDRAERERRASERAAAREAKRKERAQNKAAAKAERAALKAEFAQLPDARRVKLTLARISPLSATKIGFLVAVAFALVQLMAAALLWVVLDMLHVFSSMQGFLQALSATALVNLMDTLQLSRFLALVALNGVLQILIFTVLTWLAAVIYNIIARMVGGLHVVLTDD